MSKQKIERITVKGNINGYKGRYEIVSGKENRYSAEEYWRYITREEG